MSSIQFDIITIFPHIFDSYFSESIIKRAIQKKKIRIKIWNLRDFTKDKHKKVDDKPYGGGAGMVIQAEPVLRAVSALKIKNQKSKIKMVVLSAKGKQFTQKMAYGWSKKHKNIILISGRYEGIDERVRKILKAEEISIGPYVLTDGEVPAMAIVSAVTRLLPGVIRLESLEEESHWDRLLKKEKNGGLEYPHYTRPEVLIWNKKEHRVPHVLLSGDHRRIEAWRRRQQTSQRWTPG